MLVDSAGDDGLAGYSVKQLKEAIAARGGSYASLLEKSDLREKLRQLIRDDQRRGVTRSSSISTTSTNSTSSSSRKSRNGESGASTGCSSGNDEQRKSEIFFQNTKKFFDVQEALDGLWRSNGKVRETSMMMLMILKKIGRGLVRREGDANKAVLLLVLVVRAAAVGGGGGSGGGGSGVVVVAALHSSLDRQQGADRKLCCSLCAVSSRCLCLYQCPACYLSRLLAAFLTGSY